MSIKYQITSALLLVFFLCLIVLSTLSFYLSRVGQSSSELLEENYKVVKASEALIVSITKMDRILSKISFGSGYDQNRLFDLLHKERQIGAAHLRILEGNMYSQETLDNYNKIEKLYCSFETNIERFYTSDERKGLYLGLLQWQYDILFQRCISIIHTNHSAIMQKDKLTQNLYYQSKINSVTIAAFVVFVIGFAIQKIPYNIVQPILDFNISLKKTHKQRMRSAGKMGLYHELSELASTFNLVYEKLRETEDKFWLVTENLYDIILFCKKDHSIFYTTPSIKRALGYEEEEIKNESIFSLVHPYDVSKLRHLVSSCQEKNHNTTVELRLKHKLNKYIWMELKCASQFDKNHQPIYMQITAWDISQRKQNDRKIKLALQRERMLNKKLNHANEEIDHFLYSASHNLRGPLSTIMGLLQISGFEHSQTDNSSHETRTKTLEVIKLCTHKMDTTIHEIIEYSKNDKLQVEAGLVDFHQLIKAALQHLSTHQKHRSIKIYTDIPDNIQFYSDSRRLKTVFEVLISNAIAYQNPHQAHPTLWIKVSSKVEGVSISFKDNGIGIKEDQLDKIFEIFYRSTSASTGAGLGLYIAQKSLQKIQGDIHVNSVYGEYAEFNLNIRSIG